MGRVRARVDIGAGQDWEVFETLPLLIDTGAVHPTIPAPILEDLGIPRDRRYVRLTLADGSSIFRDMGHAWLRVRIWRSRRRSVVVEERVPVVFGEEGDEMILGVQFMEMGDFTAVPSRTRSRRALVRVSASM